MYTFNISEKGWLTTHSNDNELRINLNNVSRIQTWESEVLPYNDDKEQAVTNYVISLELCSQVDSTIKSETISKQ